MHEVLRGARGFCMGSHPQGQLGGLAGVLMANTFRRNARPRAAPALACP